MEIAKFTQAKDISAAIESLKSRLRKAEELLIIKDISCTISGNTVGNFKYKVEYFSPYADSIKLLLKSDIEQMKVKLLELETKFSEI